MWNQKSSRFGSKGTVYPLPIFAKLSCLDINHVDELSEVISYHFKAFLYQCQVGGISSTLSGELFNPDNLDVLSRLDHRYKLRINALHFDNCQTCSVVQSAENFLLFHSPAVFYLYIKIQISWVDGLLHSLLASHKQLARG